MTAEMSTEDGTESQTTHAHGHQISFFLPLFFLTASCLPFSDTCPLGCYGTGVICFGGRTLE